MRIVKSVFFLMAVAGCGGGGGAGASLPPVLSVAAEFADARPTRGTALLPISNAGGGTLQWSAALSEAPAWVRIVNGQSGSNAGAVELAFDDNPGAARSATLTVSSNDGAKSVAIAIGQSAAVSAAANLAWNETGLNWEFDFETYLSANRSWSYTRVGGAAVPVRYGHAAERFELRPGDCGGDDCQRADGNRERAEVAQRGVQNFEGDSYWYGWSFYVPPDWKDAGNLPGTSQEVTMGQFHQKPTLENGNWYPAWMFGKKYGGPFQLRSFPTEPTIKSKTFSLIDDADFAGRWHDVVIQAKWTVKDDGFLRIWINDKLKLAYVGQTMSAGNDYVYAKYGLYRPATPNNPLNSVLYYDEHRRGATRAEVDIRMIERAAQ